MKKYIVLLTSILMLLSVSEAYSQCCANPLDEVTITRNVTINGNTCEIKITFCHNISPLGIRYIKICSVDIPYDPTGLICDWSNVDLSGPVFWNIIYNELLDYSESIYSFPPCNSINQMAANIQISKGKCMRIEDDPIEMVSRIVECPGIEQFTCYIEYVVCWESGDLKKTELNRYSDGEASCISEGPIYIDPYDPFDPYPPFSPCFKSCY